VRYLLDGVVRGIGDYGNSFGVPTVGGEIYFDKSYEGNPQVNAMSVGIVKEGETASAIASGVGNPVIIAGASTGRDGIHGATFASEEISEASEAKRPSVQVGDPFTEKQLLEATLEAIKTGAVVGVQDMGAAGISCSSSEMSAKGETGMEIDLDKTPAREEGMTAYEMLLSESQERMLIVADKGREQEIIDVFEKWDLQAVVIGEVTDTKHVVYKKDGKVQADIPADSLVLGGGAPQYDREAKRPDYLDEVQQFDESTVEVPEDYKEAVLKLLSSPNIASKRWAFEQYDHMVRTNTVTGPGHSDSGVIRIKGTKKGLIMKTDCNGRYVYLNPRKGGQIAVAEAARNVVCSGGKPMAITNCLNFGNPYKPEQYWVFKEAVGGMGDACKTFSTPVTGGNVSLYNENPTGAVFPTPTIGMLGYIDNIEKVVTPGFKEENDIVLFVGADRQGLGGSEYLAWNHGLTTGDAPHLNLDFEQKLHETILKGVDEKYFKSLHDVSDGGLITTLIEKAIFSGLGANISTQSFLGNKQEILFSEAQSGVVMTVSSQYLSKVKQLFDEADIPCLELGKVNKDSLQVDDLEFNIDELKEIYEGVIPGVMNK
jgi:phosphoribosylformylglycinamidine synthase